MAAVTLMNHRASTWLNTHLSFSRSKQRIAPVNAAGYWSAAIVASLAVRWLALFRSYVLAVGKIYLVVPRTGRNLVRTRRHLTRTLEQVSCLHGGS